MHTCMHTSLTGVRQSVPLKPGLHVAQSHVFSSNVAQLGLLHTLQRLLASFEYPLWQVRQPSHTLLSGVAQLGGAGHCME